MGHYAGEFDHPKKPNEKALAKKYMELEAEIRKLPLSQMTMGDLQEMEIFRKHGLRIGDMWHLDRIQFWKDKLKKWYKENKKD